MIIREERLPEEMMCLLPGGRWQNAVFYDIETTGLGWRSSHVYLIGVLYRSDGGWILKQWLLDRPFAEKDMLLSLSEFLSVLLNRHRDAFLVDYNGTTFDLPYLQNKYLYYRLELPALLSGKDASVHSDLLALLRPLRSRLPLTSMRLQDLEKMLSTPRSDASSGKELIEVYYSFLKTGENVLRDRLFLHNRDDVAGLPYVASLLTFRGFWSGGFSVSKWEEKPDALFFTLIPERPFPLRYSLCGHTGSSARKEDPGRYEEMPERPGNCTLTFYESSALLSVPVTEGERKLFFRDYKNYYYLPAEDQAVHRSVGVFADPAFREPAKAATCYQRVSGRFVAMPGAAPIRGVSMFYTDYRDKTAWIRTEDLLTGSPDVLHGGICTILACWF